MNYELVEVGLIFTENIFEIICNRVCVYGKNILEPHIPEPSFSYHKDNPSHCV